MKNTLIWLAAAAIMALAIALAVRPLRISEQKTECAWCPGYEVPTEIVGQPKPRPTSSPATSPATSPAEMFPEVAAQRKEAPPPVPWPGRSPAQYAPDTA